MLCKDFNVKIRYIRTSGIVAVAALAWGITVLTGCGGGGGSTPLPAPSSSPIPTVSPTPQPTPTASPVTKDQALASNFVPNYVPSNSRYLQWQDTKNIRVFLHPVSNNVTDKVPTATLSPEQTRVVLEEALRIWTVATSSDFKFSLVDTEADSDIEVHFVDELRTVKGTVPVGVGITNYSFIFPDTEDKTHAILQKSVVQVAANEPFVNLVDVTTHEIGHALGIEPHSLDSNDLMFATSLPPTAITTRDLDTLFYLYYAPEATLTRSMTVPREKLPVYTAEIVCDKATETRHK